MAEVNKSWVKQLLFNAAIALKTHEIDSWIVRNNSWVDQLSSCLRSVLTFVRCALGCFVIEGYGQTECVAACTVTIEGDAVPGHVGVPLLAIPSSWSTCLSLTILPKIKPVKFASRDSMSSVLLQNEEQTKLVLDADGWLHTGDIGRWTEQGTLKIVDRKKHIFKLAQGEYIAPEKIENVYLRSKVVLSESLFLMRRSYAYLPCPN
uniref:AMP-dependent synthetase/ligase domain-containing protein n=1 Tax=Ditylenchus dipsaci TaxID=166011 RepID=A0A915D761_9BILA